MYCGSSIETEFLHSGVEPVEKYVLSLCRVGKKAEYGNQSKP